MQALSATEAIAPALSRTRNILLQPFRFSTFFKLCLVAAITEGMTGRGFNSSHGTHGGSHWGGGTFTWTPQATAVVIAMVLLAMIVALVIFYVIVRLRFALFECLARQNTVLRPGWRMYGAQSMRFFWLCIGVGVAFLVVAAGCILPLVGPLFHTWRESQGGAHLDFGALLPQILRLAAVAFGICVLGVALDVILRDFMLPHIALENDTAGEAWSEVWDRMSSEKGAFLLYGVLRVVLPLAAAIGIFIVLAIPLILIFGLPGVMMALLHVAAANAQGGMQAGYYVLEALLGVLLVALAVLVTAVIGGPLGIAIREYALMFYGGRYQRLGDILSPPATAAGAGQAS